MNSETAISETAINPNNGKTGPGQADNRSIKLSQAQRLEIIEAQIKQSDENFVKIGQYLERLQPLLTLSEQIQTRMAQAPASAGTPNPGPGQQIDIGEIIKGVQGFLNGSGNSNDAFAELGKEALKSQIEMSKAITNAVVSRVIGKASSDVAQAVTGA